MTLKKYRVISSILSLIFTDVMFFVIRIIVMVRDNSPQTGFHFMIKNILAVILRGALIYPGHRR